LVHLEAIVAPDGCWLLAASARVTSLAASAVVVISLAELAGAMVGALQESTAGEATGAGAAVGSVESTGVTSFTMSPS
jgi:hypothetical protein